VFVVQNGELKTPPLDTPVLPGTARRLVVGIARELDMRVDECPLTIDDLLDADEVLLTNAIIQVLPVIRVEKHDIHEGRVGPVAAKLLAAYRDHVKMECGRE
jgi:branched-subunit amino acid aminotransferase/4-amino-4-deoxychorismate lyase